MKIFLLAIILAFSGEAMTPQYLFKILSLRNWQATQARKALILSADDDAFVHFSMEDQLDRIIGKYWTDQGPFAVLKIDTTMLEGDLVYETNPGGTAKYYHLYRGFIPYGAIVEAKIIGEVSNAETMPIVEVGTPVLRKVARELSRDEILSPEIQTLIEQMKATMRAAPGVGIAAPQVGLGIQLTVIEDPDLSRLTEAQKQERERTEVPFHVIINPKLYLEGNETRTFFEGCLSIPTMMGAVERSRYVRVECLNERAEPVTIHAKGWYARILQHEIDHLNGVLYSDRAIPCTMMTETSFIKHWRGKTVAEIIQELSK